ncbi:mazF family transcriptional regulator (plasmid) [Candidatus Megaera polyxenophila]|jgi:antitoxin MazE|uniref:AbrB/MazE/SpoVT family DNA-binding domain-containing protein n=1 Tax=Candidatus Megaera polyxenophila TaxID=988779 RepID=UPI00249EAEEB|nr:AbrB/MazE/SpoVT family DNA-binding domain-containing protein [Candidatus Megaera polyxenophila]BBB57620.1 mazF family transcriptional regulator [Candidatus Megaera polyxenophila]
MTIKVQKWGNSLGVRIPRKIANSLHLVSGTEVEVTVNENAIVIKNNYSELDRLVQNINQANIHKEQFIEEDKQGNEAW